MSVASKNNKVRLTTYKRGIAHALITMKQTSNPRKASLRIGLNEFDIKLYFKTNFRYLSSSWMETLTANLELGTDQGWLKYNQESKHYTLNIKLLQLINQHGDKRAMEIYFKKSKKSNKNKKKLENKNTNNNNNNTELRRSARIRNQTEQKQKQKQLSPSLISIPTPSPSPSPISTQDIRHSPLKSHKTAIVIVKAAVIIPNTKKNKIISLKVDTSTPNYFNKFKHDIIEKMEKIYFPRKLDIPNSNLNYSSCSIENNVMPVYVYFKHEICTTQPSCKFIEKDGQCSIYLSMKNNYEYTTKNLNHVQTFTHFNDEYEDKPVCRHNEECYAYQRLEKGGNKVDDLCHTKLYRHPPRNRKLQLSNHCNEFKMNDLYCITYRLTKDHLHNPTNTEKKKRDKKDGFLSLLLKEVVKNGFESDLYIKENVNENDNNKKKKYKYSILNIVDEKLNCERHKSMGLPLNSAEMLSIILYTGCEINWYFCEDQRNNKYEKWNFFDYCLYNALGKLHKSESGNYKIYSGIKHVKLNRNSTNGTFKTYVSCSWKRTEAIEFMKIKGDKNEVINDGMILEINRKPPKGTASDWTGYGQKEIVYADVSWISKFPDECEVLVRRGCNVELRVRDQKQTDNVGFQVVSAHSKYVKTHQPRNDVRYVRRDDNYDYVAMRDGCRVQLLRCCKSTYGRRPIPWDLKTLLDSYIRKKIRK